MIWYYSNFDNTNGFYIFSLLPHILVHKDHDFKFICDYVSAYPDVCLLHLKWTWAKSWTLRTEDMNISISCFLFKLLAKQAYLREEKAAGKEWEDS